MVGFEAMKEEAVKRMKKLELHSDCIAAFEHDNQVWESEFLGALFELNDEKKAYIKHTEEWEMDNCEKSA